MAKGMVGRKLILQQEMKPHAEKEQRIQHEYLLDALLSDEPLQYNKKASRFRQMEIVSKAVADSDGRVVPFYLVDRGDSFLIRWRTIE
jgi:hypothetical protein